MDGLRDSILDTIGRTPVVRLGPLAPAGVELAVKLEAFNPLGSVKDRLALGVIEAAERSGRLAPGQTVVEATSGNTGIGLAMVCARKGYPLVIVMAENFSVERRRLMRFLGAKVILTPASAKGTGMVEKTRELAEAHGWFWCRQFENEANAEVHARTTAREILAAYGGRGPDVWVTGAGTGGTLLGVARVLRAESPETEVVVAEPANAPVLASGIPQARRDDGTPAASHPAFRPHPMQGWSPDFVPRLTGEAMDSGLVDRIEPVDGAEAIRVARELARREGILCGISGGATVAAGLAAARRARPGTRILCMVPDTGERYLSTPLFDAVGAEMDADELDIAASTPGYRFGGPAPAQAAPAGEPAEAPVAGLELLDRAIADPETPVVMFALEWCEFCWSLRRFFDDLGLPWRSVDLDAPALAKDGTGAAVRAALRVRTGAPTIPQVFIGGTHLGGCTETLEAFDDGRLGALLDRHGIAWRRVSGRSGRDYLPAWLAARPA